jgi:hypothetical protein
MKTILFDRSEENDDKKHDKDEEKEDKENNGKKDFEDEHFDFGSLEIEEDEVKVESESENCEIEYEIKSKDIQPIICKMEYESKNITSGVETETKSRVLIHGIQEWFDINNDGIMSDDEKVGDLYFVGSNEYETITYSGPDIYDIYNFTIQEKPEGYLTMIAYLTSNFTEYYNPNSMKFDIIISNWNYEHIENQLALLMEYRTETEMESSDEDGYVSQKSTDPSLGYSALQWTSTFTYDDSNIGTIQTRILNNTELELLIHTDDDYEEEQSSGMWFCFSSKGANSIYWDPDIGVYTTPISANSNSNSNSNSKSNDFTISGAKIGAIIGCSIIGIGIIATLLVVASNKIRQYRNTNNLEKVYLSKVDL